jgi:glycosyltransferase involved in cell wall biosynthesis
MFDGISVVLDAVLERARVQQHFGQPIERVLADGVLGELLEVDSILSVVFADHLRKDCVGLVATADDRRVGRCRLPCHLAMGVALKRVIERTGITTISHEHDFDWERGDRYETRYHGVRAIIDDVNRHVPQEWGFDRDDILLFQITRVVRRKGIERAIELVERLDDPRVKLVVTGHATDDRNERYLSELRDRGGCSVPTAPGALCCTPVRHGARCCERDAWKILVV